MEIVFAGVFAFAVVFGLSSHDLLKDPGADRRTCYVMAVASFFVAALALIWGIDARMS